MADLKARPSSISIADKVLIDVEKHAYSNLEAEVGGMLFGRIDEKGNTRVIGSIPALTAAAEQISLTFTHDVWADILSKGQKQYPGEVIVGWYHTHPSFGLFLSDYDEFIQRNFFGQVGQIALVIDPIAGEMGWFLKGADDKIDMVFREATKIGPKSPSAPPSVLESNWKGRVLTHGAAAAVSAALTWGFMFTTSGPDLRDSYQSLFESYNFLAAYAQQPNYSYVASTGDTYRSISRMFYGDSSGANSLRLDNGGVDVQAGMTIFVRGPVRFEVADPQYLPPELQQLPEGSTGPGIDSTPTPSASTPPAQDSGPLGPISTNSDRSDNQKEDSPSESSDSSRDQGTTP